MGDLTFKTYSEIWNETAVYPGKGFNITYPTLGLAGEAGEVADKVKKVIRDQGGVVGVDTMEALAYELGDVLWYICALAGELGLSLEQIAKANMEKLLDRKERGKLKGSGDSR